MFVGRRRCVSGHYNFADNYGRHSIAGVYNGEKLQQGRGSTTKRASRRRATLRPFPLGGPWLKGLARHRLRSSEDNYVEDAKRQRGHRPGSTYESTLFNAGVDYLRATDQTSATKAEVKSKGWSVWATPKFGNQRLGKRSCVTTTSFRTTPINSQKQKARPSTESPYWFPNTGGKALAVLLDRELAQAARASRPAVSEHHELRSPRWLVNF